jgi:hypothetical protein
MSCKEQSHCSGALKRGTLSVFIEQLPLSAKIVSDSISLGVISFGYQVLECFVVVRDGSSRSKSMRSQDGVHCSVGWLHFYSEQTFTFLYVCRNARLLSDGLGQHLKEANGLSAESSFPKICLLWKVRRLTSVQEQAFSTKIVARSKSSW